MTTLAQIATLYIQYHKLRKEIADLKYSRTLDFKPCDMGEPEPTSCYTMQKKHGNYDMCPACAKNWAAHREIVRLGHKAGGIKYSLGRLIEKV